MQSKDKRRLEIKIRPEEEARQASAAHFLDAWRKGEYAGEYLTFISPAMFFDVLNARRWDLIIKLQKAGKTSIRELARQAGRDTRQVQEDVKVLLAYGIVEDSPDGVCVPYAEIHADFTVKAEAA